ncbi:unnamed protein product, partial [Allacma fusca]
QPKIPKRNRPSIASIFSYSPESNIRGYWSQEEEKEKRSPALRYPQENSENRLPAALRTCGRGRSVFAVILDVDFFLVDDCNGERAIFYTKEDILSETLTLEKCERFGGKMIVVGAMSGGGCYRLSEFPQKSSGIDRAVRQGSSSQTKIIIIKNTKIPAKTPDASPMDVFGFGFLTQTLQSTKVCTMNGLWKKFREVWNEGTSERCVEVIGFWKRRLLT